MSNTNRPINLITVLCNPRHVRRIAFTCRCKHRWTENVPAELHDSDMIAQFECPKCSTLYHLHHKQLHRVGGHNDRHTQDTTQPIAHIDTTRYDS